MQYGGTYNNPCVLVMNSTSHFPTDRNKPHYTTASFNLFPCPSFHMRISIIRLTADDTYQSDQIIVFLVPLNLTEENE